MALLFSLPKDDWATIKKEFLGDPKAFINKVNDYNIDEMSRELYDVLEIKFTSLPDFTVEKMNSVSIAAANLTKWVLYIRD